MSKNDGNEGKFAPAASSEKIQHLVPRIGVVDSCSGSRDALIGQLVEQSFETRAFTSAQSFLHFLEESGSLDLAVIDLGTEDINGWCLVRRLRSFHERSVARRLPIILKSNLLTTDLGRDLSLSMGADAFLHGPLTSTELLDSIRHVLSGRSPRPARRHLIVGDGCWREVSTILSRAGHESVTVSEPMEAELRLTTYRPDIVLIDRALVSTLNAQKVREIPATILLISKHPGRGGSHSLLNLPNFCGEVRWPDEPGQFLAALDRCHQAQGLWRLHQGRQLGESENFLADTETFRLLLDGIPDPALILDHDGVILDSNKAYQNAMCCEAAYLMGHRASDYISSPELSQLPFEGPKTGDREPVVEGLDVICTRINGTTFQAQLRSSGMSYQGKRVTILFLRDRTLEESAREAVRVSEAKLRIIAENTSDWEFWRSPHGHFLYSSSACEKICGYTHREFEMQPDFLKTIALPGDHDRLPEREEALRPNEPVEKHLRIISRSGSIRWIQYNSHPIYDDHGNILGRRGSIRDVTDEHHVAREREILGAAVEQSSEAIAISDLQGNIEYANPAFRRLFRWSPRTRERKPLSERRWRKLREGLRSGRSWSGNLSRRDKEGLTRLTLQVSLSPMRDQSGYVRQIIWVVRDLTAETELRERLETAQRLDSLGNLAGGLAHDFNNLLASILGHASLLSTFGDETSEVGQAASVIATAARRASDLTQKLLGFARGGKNAHEAFSVHQVLEEAVSLLGRNLPKGAALEWDLKAESPWIDGDPSQISQVLINLCINATHALDKSEGVITFQSWNTVDPQSGDEELHLTIKDNGCGMTKETLQRVFEPFFTTKATGSGLGLSMVYGIVGNHGGRVAVESEVGVGTTFTLIFPVTTHRPSQLPPKEVDESVAAAPRRRERILIIDDEDMVRLTLSRMLKKLGFEVVDIGDAEAGLALYQNERDTIGFVILDMQMPGVDGLECFERLRAFDPEVRAVMATGFCHPDMARRAIDQGILQVISKPFDYQQLARLIGQHLQRQSVEAS